MSRVESFEIHLEHDIDEQYQYEPGEVLRGNVFLHVTGPVKVKAIQVHIRGEANVSWEEEAKGRPVTYRADETYVDVTQNLLHPSSGSAELQAGKHRFPLEYTLPHNLPSSFIGKFGSITYVVKATLKEDKRIGLSSMITSEPFLVLRKLDLAREKNVLKFHEERADKRMWGAFAFCISGKVNAKVSLNKTGHLPGEDIHIDSEITNSSPRTVHAVQAAIVMHSTFHARNKTKYNTQIVNKKRDEWEMGFGDGRRWRNVRLTIPPYIPESRLDGCDIVDISYELQFRVEISGKQELRINVPLVVGTTQSDTEYLDDQGRAVKSGMPNAQHYIKASKDHTPDPIGNGDLQNGDVNHRNSAEDIDFEMDDEEAEQFRRPMEPGTIRRNPIFTNREQKQQQRISEQEVEDGVIENIRL